MKVEEPVPENISRTTNFPSATVVGHLVVVLGNLRRNAGARKTSFCTLDYSLNRWTWHEVDGPTFIAHCAWLRQDTVWVYGGYRIDSAQSLPERLGVTTLWTLDLVSKQFSERITFGERPGSRRENSSGHYLERHGAFLLFGGLQRPATFSNETFLLDFHSMRWRKPPVKGKLPAPCFQHGSTVVGDVMFLFGGWASGARVDAGVHLLKWNSDCTRFTWSELKLESPSFTLSSFVFKFFDGAFVMFGGYSNEKRSVLTVFEPSEAKFHNVSRFHSDGRYSLDLDNDVPHTGCQTCVQVGNKLLAFGGSGVYNWSYIELTAL